MDYWETLGRVVIARETSEGAERMCEYLTYSGVDATVSLEQDSTLYVVTVPKDQEPDAGRLMERYHLQARPAEEQAEAYRRQTLSPSPSFVPSEEKFRTSTNSSFIFVICGAVIFVMALVHFFLIIYHVQEGTMDDCVLELILGFIFLMFGITTQQKVRIMKDKILEENAFNDQLIRWFTQTYPADYLDRLILAASDDQDIPEEEMFFLRRQLIHDNILREYDIKDTAYLDYITDLIYKKLYVPNGMTAA